MRRKLIHLFSMTNILIVASCNDTVAPDLSLDNQEPQLVAEKIKKLDPEKESLTSSDAEIVANLLMRNNATRSTDNKDIKDIVTISDDAGQPAIYAVNFEQGGYILISAVKKYYPILAMIDQGYFSYDDTPQGEKILIRKMLNQIEKNQKSLTDSTANKIDKEWQHFEMSEKPSLTRGDGMTDEEYQEIYDRFACENDCNDGLYKLTDCENILPEDVYQTYCENAEAYSDNLFGGTKFGWEHTALVMKIWDYKSYDYGQILTTHWDQFYDESSSATLLGCVTIATGQLMKYFRYPSTFNWDDMPDNKCTDTTTQFLRRLKSELNTDSNNASTLEEATRVLNSYGYNCYLTSHNGSTTISSLKQNKPVIQRGHISGAQYGHAWICDSYKHSMSSYIYYLYVLDYTLSGEIDYTRVPLQEYQQWEDTGSSYFHMNWGQGGIHDGWFRDDLNDAPSELQYKATRQDIIITGFN